MRKTSLYTFAAWLTGLLTICSLQACKRDSEVDPGFGPDGQPRVLAMHIADIPDQNILIDQETKQITVTVPTSFSAQLIKPSLTLTPSTTTLSGYDYSVVTMEVNISDYPLIIKTDGGKTNTYALVLKPAGELKLGTLTGSQTYSLTDKDTYICLPVYNFVDGAKTSAITLVNKTTGARIKPVTWYSARSSLCDETARTDGAAMVTIYVNGFSTYYQPGEYAIELTKANGRSVTTTQTIQLARSAPNANFNVNYSLALNSGDYLLYGANFYQTDKLSVRLRGRDQQEQTLDAIGFVDKQPGIRLPTALKLKPGYYYSQLIVNGVPTTSTGRFSISDQVRPLLIAALSVPNQATNVNLLGETYALDVPVPFTRGVTYNISTNSYQFTQSDTKAVKRVQLTLLSDPTKVYTIPFNTESTTSSEQITIPSTTPAGRYQLTVQVIKSDGTVINGLPLERDVAIQ